MRIFMRCFYFFFFHIKKADGILSFEQINQEYNLHEICLALFQDFCNDNL